MRRVVEQLDRPGSEASIGRNIEMTMTLLRCSPKAPASPEPLPADMEAVARQLRATTQYKDIQLWDTLPLHLQEGTTTQEMIRLPGTFGPGQVARGNFEVHPDAVYRKDQIRYVRFSRLRLEIQMPVPAGPSVSAQFSYVPIQLHTSGDFAEGQKTVLGKISGASDDDAIFAVITLKVLE